LERDPDFELPILLRDHTAGDAVAGVAGGIGLHVVGLGMDYDRSAAVAEERVGAVAESYVCVLQFCICLAFGVYGEVVHVTGVVAVGIFQAVLLVFGIEVRAGRFEVGGLALGVLMKVDGVLTGRQIMKSKLEADAGSLLPQGDRPDGFALSVLEFDFGLGGAGERENKQSDS
jgi:hypothetical protein